MIYFGENAVIKHLENVFAKHKNFKGAERIKEIKKALEKGENDKKRRFLA